MNVLKAGLLMATWIMLISCGIASAQSIKGRIIDYETSEPMTGATVRIEGSDKAAVAGNDGKFEIGPLSARSKYTLLVDFMSYVSQRIENVRAGGDSLVIKMKMDEQVLREAGVTGVARKNTDIAMVHAARISSVIVSNVSAQEITRTQDSNAGEVIRRIPGVSVIEDKFVMVRGLSQRYNNVWINGAAVPSSEADARAFSFDIIPSAQIDNITVVKTPSSEYPSDYSGGFILIDTKEIPDKDRADVSFGGSWNSSASWKPFITGDMPDPSPADGFSRNWGTRTRTPYGDLHLSADLGKSWKFNGNLLGLMAAASYSTETRTYTDMQNNLYGVYDVENDRSNYLRFSTDDQYNYGTRSGAMLNLTFLPSSGGKFRLMNIFNNISGSRYTWRNGVSAQADLEKSAEYYQRERNTFSSQLTGSHNISSWNLDWSLGYSFAGRNIPDRRRYLVDDSLESGVFAISSGNDISREWTRLGEHIMSAAINAGRPVKIGPVTPELKFGAYGEYRTRTYTTREFIYNWDATSNTLPLWFRRIPVTQLLSDPDNYGSDRLNLLELLNMRNNYGGRNTVGSAYMTANVPFGKFKMLAGARLEYSSMELISNTRDDVASPRSRYYNNLNVFPSFNLAYAVSAASQLRLSYGRTVNRPEFREASSSVFYDFDLASSVQGNTELRECFIDNLDLRYELYPSRSEQISFALFYKHFDSPIEWTYTVSGGTDLIYSYRNADQARSYGLEVDIKKDLSFIGLRGLSWSLNGALINSQVQFSPGSREKDRPMQGQSPYLVNTGLFYTSEALGLDIALLYNRIGRRIIGVGRSEGTTGSDDNAKVPDSYEMPRDVLDLSLSKAIGKHLNLKMNLRDILAEDVVYQQTASVVYADGQAKEIQQITRRYSPGRNLGVSITYKF